MITAAIYVVQRDHYFDETLVEMQTRAACIECGLVFLLTKPFSIYSARILPLNCLNAFEFLGIFDAYSPRSSHYAANFNLSSIDL